MNKKNKEIRSKTHSSNEQEFSLMDNSTEAFLAAGN
jgi:hypothetical protein